MGELKSDLLAAKEEIAAFHSAKKELVRLPVQTDRQTDK